MKWIDFDKEQPKNSGIFLVFMQEDNEDGVRDILYFDGEGWLLDEPDDLFYEVKYWMRLPACPRTDGDSN